MKYDQRAILTEAPQRAFKGQSRLEGFELLGWEGSREGRKPDDRGLAE